MRNDDSHSPPGPHRKALSMSLFWGEEGAMDQNSENKSKKRAGKTHEEEQERQPKRRKN